MARTPPSTNAALFARVPLDSPGTPTEQWAEAAASLPQLDTEGLRHMLLVVAHPDDECLGPGALAHTLASQGCTVTVVIVSGGQQSHAHDPTVNPVELAALRLKESESAAEIIGTERPIVLGFPDGDLEAHETAIVSDLRDIFCCLSEDLDGSYPAVVTHWRGDGHPDHEAVGRCVVRAVQSVSNGDESLFIWEFPLWALHWDSPEHGQFPLADAMTGPQEEWALGQKRQAVACFTTQVSGWPQENQQPVMPEHIVERLLKAPELFLPVSFNAVSTDFQRSGKVDDLDHLQVLYADNPDPWGLETSSYEADKRRATLRALPGQRYDLCFEVGSSIGVLTSELIQRADRLIGWEPVERAADTARRRIAGMEAAQHMRAGSARIETRALSAVHSALGPRGADLIVLSEVLYFIPHEELAPIVRGLCTRAQPGAHLIAVHWKHPVAGWPEGGAGTHRLLAEEPLLRRLSHDDDSSDYLLEVFQVLT